jgi:plasmid stabilization system protein ParE
MVKIIWTELSISDLKEIFDYIAEDSISYDDTISAYLPGFIALTIFA